MRGRAWLLGACMALAVTAVSAQSINGFPDSRFIEQRERFTPEGGDPIELRFLIARELSGQTTRVVNTTHAAVTMLSEWFGPLPSLTVAGVPWHGVGAPQPGIAAAPLRWLAPVRDQSSEHALIAAITRQYWRQDAAPASFEAALEVFTATRAIHQLLEGSNFATPRFFGGHVPFPLRSVLLSPPVGDPRPRVGFDFGSQDAAVSRGVGALQTIERYVGWPTLLNALVLMRKADRHDSTTLGAALSEVRGTNLQSLVAECWRADATFDYAIENLTSAAAAGGLVESTVTIARRGNGRFAADLSSDDSEAAMPIEVRFADGTVVRDFFDGAAPSATLLYSAKSAAVSATVDPDEMLLLDVDRANNTIVRDAPSSPLGVRLALNWMAWLQNAMLSYTALL
jgi:hypothetical protein